MKNGHYVETDNREVPEEARVHAVRSWCRVTRADGSTVAFVPDKTTADAIARMLDEREEGL